MNIREIVLFTRATPGSSLVIVYFCRGEVLLVREFGQECRNCGALRYPKFDDESAAKTVGKVVERILKVFYGLQSTEKFVNPIR